MKKTGKRMVGVLVAAVLMVTLAGCAGQQQQSQEQSSQSAASSQELPPSTQENLLNELKTQLPGDGFKSVTIQMNGISSIGSEAAAMAESSDSGSLSSLGASSPSAQSASADAADSSSESEEGLESSASSGSKSAASDDSSESVDESSEEDSIDDSSALDKSEESSESDAEGTQSASSAGASSSEAASDEAGDGLSVVAKCDLSGSAPKTQAAIDVAGRSVELYIDGTKASLVRDGQVTEGTVEKLGMSQYADVKAIIQSQAADVTLFEDAIENIEATTDDTKIVYKVTCDPQVFAEDNDATTVFSKYNRSMKLESAEIVYTFDTSRRLMAVETNVRGPEFFAQYESKLTDYDTTKVEVTPDLSSSNDESSEYDDYSEYEDYSDSGDESETETDADTGADAESDGAEDADSAGDETE